MLLARNPNKFLVSFQSDATDGAKFFIKTWYSDTLTGEKFVNREKCTDEGKNLTGIETDDNNGGSSGGKNNSETDPKDEKDKPQFKLTGSS